MDHKAKEEGLTGSCLSELSHPRLPEKTQEWEAVDVTSSGLMSAF